MMASKPRASHSSWMQRADERQISKLERVQSLNSTRWERCTGCLSALKLKRRRKKKFQWQLRLYSSEEINKNLFLSWLEIWKAIGADFVSDKLKLISGWPVDVFHPILFFKCVAYIWEKYFFLFVRSSLWSEKEIIISHATQFCSHSEYTNRMVHWRALAKPFRFSSWFCNSTTKTD